MPWHACRPRREPGCGQIGTRLRAMGKLRQVARSGGCTKYLGSCTQGTPRRCWCQPRGSRCPQPGSLGQHRQHQPWGGCFGMARHGWVKRGADTSSGARQRQQPATAATFGQGTAPSPSTGATLDPGPRAGPRPAGCPGGCARVPQGCRGGTPVPPPGPSKAQGPVPTGGAVQRVPLAAPQPINPAMDLCRAGAEAPLAPPRRGTAPTGDEPPPKTGHVSLGHRLDPPAPSSLATSAAGPVPHIQRPAPASGLGRVGAPAAWGLWVHGPQLRQPPLPWVQPPPRLCLGGRRS